MKGQKKKNGERGGSKMEEGEWGGETGRRLGGAPLGGTKEGEEIRKRRVEE